MSDAFDYSEIRDVADELLAEFGQTAIVKRTAPGSGPAYDPGDPTITYYSVIVTVALYKNYQINGTLIRTGDKRVTMAAGTSAIVPTVDDTINIGGTLAGDVVTGGTWHNIIQVLPTSPGGTDVLYVLQCRV